MNYTNIKLFRCFVQNVITTDFIIHANKLLPNCLAKNVHYTCTSCHDKREWQAMETAIEQETIRDWCSKLDLSALHDLL